MVSVSRSRPRFHTLGRYIFCDCTIDVASAKAVFEWFGCAAVAAMGLVLIPVNAS
jgi:hypothetical protein